jgi:hypothetical protein
MKKIYRLSPYGTVDDSDFWRLLNLRETIVTLDEYERVVAQIREHDPNDPRIPHLPEVERLIVSVRKCMEARKDAAAMDGMVMLNKRVRWLDALFNAPVMKTGTKLRSSFAPGTRRGEPDTAPNTGCPVGGME